MSFLSAYNRQFSIPSRSQPKNPIGKPTAQDRDAKEKASRERRKAVEKASRERRKAALRSKKAAVRNTRETFKHLPGTSGGRRTRRNKSALRKTRRSRK